LRAYSSASSISTRGASGAEEIIRAFEKAGAWSWVSSLEQGLDTFVGEDGMLLSGGQRQRLVLARVLLSNAAVVILDEPTAHLDTASAAAFVDEVVTATSERGLLMITHRLAGLERFDEIIVLDAGPVVERGSWCALCERGGRFAALLR
jgi:ABC-type multidrug transport system fused ATPase/permease subunit